MKNFTKLFGAFVLSASFFTACENGDNEFPDLPESSCHPNQRLMMLGTVFNNNPNSTIDYNSFSAPGLNNPMYHGQAFINVPLTNELPTNTSFYDQISGYHGIFISRAARYVAFDINNNVGQGYPIPATNTPTAPALIGGAGYVIQVQGNYANQPTVNFTISTFNLSNGNLGSALPLNIGNFPLGSFFNMENISSASNDIDSLFFLGGTNLLMVDVVNNTANVVDLYPNFNQSNNYARFIGLEYYDDGELLAVLQTFPNNQALNQLVKINVSQGIYSPVMVIPGDINSEFYSTAFERCDQQNAPRQMYYLTTKDVGNSIQTKYYEIDLLNNSIQNQTFADYQFGIELYSN